MYYKTNMLLAPGDIIRAGNWGRAVLGIGGVHNAFFKEYLLERIRASEFPTQPSRLAVAFVFDVFEDARRWTRSNVPEVIYRVRLANPETECCTLDMSWIDLMGQYHSFEGVETVARKYWAGEQRQPDAMERLVTGDLVIEERMTTFHENGHAS